MALCSRSGKKAKGVTTSCLRWGKKAKRALLAPFLCWRMQPNWLELPRHITANILQKLSVVEDIMSASQVCSSWWNIYKDPLMWRTIDMTKYPAYSNSKLQEICSSTSQVCSPWWNIYKDPLMRRTIDMTKYPAYSNAKLQEICRYAIDRSCGHLEDISIRIFATDDLLKYIAKSTSNLRRLRLPECEAISDEVLIEVAKKLPLLEELDISDSNFTADSIKIIGQSCPHLQALKFSSWQSFSDSHYIEEVALAIAETMPQLRHLDFCRNRLNDKGLVAVIKGCPLIEYLNSLHTGYRQCPRGLAQMVRAMRHKGWEGEGLGFESWKENLKKFNFLTY